MGARKNWSPGSHVCSCVLSFPKNPTQIHPCVHPGTCITMFINPLLMITQSGNTPNSINNEQMNSEHISTMRYIAMKGKDPFEASPRINLTHILLGKRVTHKKHDSTHIKLTKKCMQNSSRVLEVKK